MSDLARSYRHRNCRKRNGLLNLVLVAYSTESAAIETVRETHRCQIVVPRQRGPGSATSKWQHYSAHAA